MQERDFVTYEYKTVSVKAQDQSRAADLYEAFGWEITASEPAVAGGVTLSLKRDRKLPHRAELNRLERQAEGVAANIDRLQRSKTLGADIFAYIFGVVAALILGGGMCLVMLVEGSLPALIGGIALGVVGIALCCVNYPIRQKIAANKTKQVLPLIDESEEKLANLLEQGNGLLRADVI